MRSSAQKLALFQSLFTGRHDAYGTHDPRSGRTWQVKEPLTRSTVLSHLQGKQPLGLYLLREDGIRAAVVDFDDGDGNAPLELLVRARHLGIEGYIEISKSKGFHVWFFLSEWAPARTVRIVLKGLLSEIERPEVEVFPKQDIVHKDRYGNFINLPLFGAYAAKQKTVFVDSRLLPVADQWAFLERVRRSSPQDFETALEMNDFEFDVKSSRMRENESTTFGLPLCARSMLSEGVSSFQRVSCFRLAVHLRKAGLPLNAALVVLKEWARRNRPTHGKSVIAEQEIESQTRSAYGPRQYLGCGCESEAVRPYCDVTCPLKRRNERNQ